jgi:hypothetical protein
MLVGGIPRAALSALARPLHRVAAAGRAAAGHEHLPAVARGARLGVDGQHHALGAEDLGQLVEQLGALDRGRVDRDLVRPGVEHGLRVGHRADPAADRERHEDVVGRAPGQVDQRVATLVGGGDVEEDELVGAGGVVALGQLDRIARVADVDEVRALDHAAGVDVQAGDHALVVHALHGRPGNAYRWGS